MRPAGPLTASLASWMLVGCATTTPQVEPAIPTAVEQVPPAPVASTPAPEIVEPAPPVTEVVPEPPPEPDPPPPGCAVTRPVLAHPPAAAIDDARGAMRPFYDAMVATLLDREGAVTRIGHWSDSTLAADGVSSYARRRLQLAYGDAGHGFVLPIRQIPHYHHKDVQRWSGGRWLNVPLVGGKTRDGRYGLGGWVSIGRRGAWTAVGTAGRRSEVGLAMSKLHLYFLAAPNLGSIQVKVDGERVETVDTAADERADAMHTIRVPDGPHRISLRVSTSERIRLFGTALERDVPGVIYDSFGLLGALARRFSRVDREHWHKQLAFRDHDLVIIQFGGNSIQNSALNFTRYREQFRDLVRLFRQGAPDAACLVMSPHDHGRRRTPFIIDTAPKLIRLMSVQRAVAEEEGCAWFSTFDAMGGDGSMGRFYRERKAYADLRHLRLRGAKIIADHLIDALEHGFNRYLDTLDCPTPDSAQ